MQAFLERAAVVCDMNRGELNNKNKVGASVAAVRRGGALQAIDAMNHFFKSGDDYRWVYLLEYGLRAKAG